GRVRGRPDRAGIVRSALPARGRVAAAPNVARGRAACGDDVAYERTPLNADTTMRLKTLSLGILTAAVLASLQATPAAAAPPGLAASFASATTTHDVALPAPAPATDGARAEPRPARACPRHDLPLPPDAP